MRRHNQTAVFATALAAALMLTACGSQTGSTTAAQSSEKETVTEAKTAAESTTDGKTTAAETAGAGTITKDEIIIANSTDIKSMDPQDQSDVISGILINHIYNRLLKLTDGKLECELAESYEMLDDTTYHFKIREGVKFHNGEELKASDVKFTLDRARTMFGTTSYAAHFDTVTVDGDYDVTLTLKEPYPGILYALSGMNLSILSEKAVTEAGEDYAMNPIGTGPFRFDEWVPNDHWTIVRNDEYYGGKPLSKKLTCRVIPEAGSRCIALETGEVDVALKITETEVPNIVNNKELKLYAETGASIEFIGMNMEHEYLKDERVRHAIQYAIDKQAIVDTIIEGHGEVANSYVGKTVPGWDPDLEPYPYDPEKAKELLAEAGYADGFELTMIVNGDVRSRTGEIVQAQLAEIGIKLDLSTYDFGAYLDMLQKGDEDLFILGWSNGGDTDRSVSTLFMSDQCNGNGNNYTFLKDEAFDKEIQAAASETDNEKRMEMYKEIQAHLKEISPWVPLYYQQTIAATRADLKGFVFDANLTYYCGDCRYEK